MTFYPGIMGKGGGSNVPYNAIFSVANAYRYNSSAAAGCNSFVIWDLDKNEFYAARRSANNQNIVAGDYTISINSSSRVTFQCPYDGKLYYNYTNTSSSASSGFSTLTNEVDYTANSVIDVIGSTVSEKLIVVGFIKS